MKQIYSLLAVLCIGTVILSAQEGSLDPSFNTTGKVVTPFSGFNAYVYGTAIQSDGKIVAVGYTSFGYANRFAITRYTVNGSLDNSFGTGGKVITEVSTPTDDQAYAVVIQPDGKILVGGRTYDDGQSRFALVRYDVNGSPDASFGTNGIVKTPIGTNDDAITALALQPDGKIVAGGISDLGSYVYQFAVVRYNSNGTLDASFDTDGIVTTHLRSGNDKIRAIAVQSDGKIIAAGYSVGPNSEYDCAMVRYNTNGSLDTGFDTDGIALTPVGAYSSTINSIAIQSDGKIVAGGYAQPTSTYYFALVRYNTNGSLDTGFDTDGKVIVSVGSGENGINSIALQSDGRIVAAGYDATNVAIARFNTNGSLDTGFDTDGKVTTAVGSTSSVARSIAIQSNGRIVVAGSSTDDGSVHNFAVARYSGAVPTSGNALRFDGDDYVNIPYSANLNPAQFTYEIWARVDGGDGSFRTPMSSRDYDGFSSVSGVHFYAGDDNKWQGWIGRGGSGWSIITGSDVVEGEWTHLAETYDGTTQRFYVNGVLQGSAVVSFTQNTLKPVRFGSTSDDLNYYFVGNIDEARIWNIALDSTTIQQRMHRTIDPGTSNLVGYWQFNNNSGGTAFESHGYSGVLNNFNYNGTSGWVSSTIASAPGTSNTSSAFTSGTASMGDVSLATTDAFDNAVNLTATVLSAIPNTVPGSYTSVIGDKYYVVNVFGVPGTYTANLTINFGASTLDSRVDTNPGGVRLYRRSSISDGAWTLVGGAASANSTTGNVTWNGLTSLGQFAAVYEESALPVELISFTASAQQKAIELKWKTATETNNHGFDVERRAVNDRHLEGDGHFTWTKSGFVKGNGNSNSPKEYSFSDKNITSGRYIYRLKQVDRDGKYEYSKEVEVTVGSVPNVFALEQNYPNPFNPSTSIGFTLQSSGMTTLKVYDAIGREVATLTNENLEAGVYHQRTFDASRLSSGIYFARLSSSGRTQLKKMMLVK